MFIMEVHLVFHKANSGWIIPFRQQQSIVLLSFCIITTKIQIYSYLFQGEQSEKNRRGDDTSVEWIL